MAIVNSKAIASNGLFGAMCIAACLLVSVSRADAETEKS